MIGMITSEGRLVHKCGDIIEVNERAIQNELGLYENQLKEKGYSLRVIQKLVWKRASKVREKHTLYINRPSSTIRHCSGMRKL